MQPFNYMIDGGNPGQAFAQAFQQQRAAVAQNELAEKQKQQAMRLQNALSGLGGNPTPQQFAEITSQFPDLVEPLTKQYRALDDVSKIATWDAGQRAFMALNANDGGESAVKSLEESATAFENSGRPELAAQYKGYAKAIRENPAGGRAVIGTLLSFTEPDKWKKIVETTAQPGDTPFIKELIAEGLKPGSPEFTEALKAKRQDSPFVVVPGVGVFSKKDVLAAAENGTVTPAVPERAIRMLRANPGTRDLFDKEFGAGASDAILGPR